MHVVLLQAAPSGLLIDSQLLGAVTGALLAALLVAVGHIYSRISDHGERLVKVETVQSFYLRSTEQNRREVVTPNPLSPEEQGILDMITSEGGDMATIGELEIARLACFRESMDMTKTPGEREKYKNLLPVLDARWALKRLEEAREHLSPWRRFLAGLR